MTAATRHPIGAQLRRGFLLAMLAALASCAAKPETVLEDTLRAVEDGHCDKFSERFPAATRAMMGAKLDRTCVQEAAKLAAEPDGQRIADVRILSHTVNGEVATVTAEVHHRSGVVNKPLIARLVKEDGVWRLEPAK